MGGYEIPAGCWERIDELFNAAARAGMAGDHAAMAGMAGALAEGRPEGGSAARCVATSAEALRRAGRPDEALDAIDAALEAGADAYAWNQKGMILEARGDADGAIEAYGRAAGCDAGRSQRAARSRLALLLGTAGRHEEAVAEARRALEADPGDRTARAALAGGLGGLGRHKEALEAAEAAPGGGMDDAKVMPHIAMGDLEAALECAGRAARAMPADAAMWHIKARLLADLGRDEESLDALTVAAAISPAHARIAAGDDGFERMRGGERFGRIVGK